jgi:hypothetical protein
MLNTKQPVLRRFWYAVMPIDLKDGPRPFTLLGEPIVLFLDRKGAVGANWTFVERSMPTKYPAASG